VIGSGNYIAGTTYTVITGTVNGIENLTIEKLRLTYIRKNHVKNSW